MYRREEMKADAAAKGWNLVAWFRAANVARYNGYDFLKGKTNSAKVAAALTSALGKRPGFYQVRRGKAA